MMRQQRTDLAAEARQIWQEGAGEAAALPGVSARDYRRRGFSVTRVEILDGAGAEALGKPAGTYITVDLGPYFENRGERFAPAAQLRQRGEQRPGVRMAGIVENLLAGADFHDVARVHHGDAVRHVGHHAEIVRDIHAGQVQFLA